MCIVGHHAYATQQITRSVTTRKTSSSHKLTAIPYPFLLWWIMYSGVAQKLTASSRRPSENMKTRVGLCRPYSATCSWCALRLQLRRDVAYSRRETSLDDEDVSMYNKSGFSSGNARNGTFCVIPPSTYMLPPKLTGSNTTGTAIDIWRASRMGRCGNVLCEK